MVRFSRREGLFLMLGAGQAALLGAPSAGSAYTPFRFVTTDNPPVDHTGVADRPGYSPTDPRSASVIDPMSGLEIFRVGGDNGSTLFINGTQDSGLKFPRRLRQENNPRMQKVWNADATLLMIDRRYNATGDKGDARSYLIDVDASHGASQPWRIIRTSSRVGLGDRPVGPRWFWDMLNPLRAYVVARKGMYEWWPVGGAGHSTGETNPLFPWPSGYSQFDAIRRGNMQTSHDGLTYIAGARRNSDGKWGGFKVNLATGQFGDFIPSDPPFPPANPNNRNHCLAGTSASGKYGWFSRNGPDVCFADVDTGQLVSNTRAVTGVNFISHFDHAMVDGIDYSVGHRRGFKIWAIQNSQLSEKTNFPGNNPQHTSTRNWKDTFENHWATGGSTSGLRYAIWTRSGSSDGHPRGIMGIRLGANDFNVVRYICNHRGVRKANANECHPNVSPNVEYIVFNSNWHEPGVVSDGDVHPYVVLMPDAWYSPNNDGA
jgi:hypothetical protein